MLNRKQLFLFGCLAFTAMLLMGAYDPTSGGGGNVFTTNSNTFVAGNTNTFNGTTTTSNLTVFGQFVSTNDVTLTNWISRLGVKADSANNEILFFTDVSGTKIASITRTGLDGGGIRFNSLSGTDTFRLTDSGLTVEDGGFNIGANSGNNFNSLAPVNSLGNTSGTSFNTLFGTNLLNGVTTIGSNGTAVVFLKTATASLDYPNIIAAGTADLQITLTGATTNDIVMMGRPASEDPSLVTRGIVLSNNVVTVRANNVGGIAVDQAPMTYRIDVIHH